MCLSIHTLLTLAVLCMAQTCASTEPNWDIYDTKLPIPADNRTDTFGRCIPPFYGPLCDRKVHSLVLDLRGTALFVTGNSPRYASLQHVALPLELGGPGLLLVTLEDETLQIITMHVFNTWKSEEEAHDLASELISEKLQGKLLFILSFDMWHCHLDQFIPALVKLGESAEKFGKLRECDPVSSHFAYAAAFDAKTGNFFSMLGDNDYVKPRLLPPEAELRLNIDLDRSHYAISGHHECRPPSNLLPSGLCSLFPLNNSVINLDSIYPSTINIDKGRQLFIDDFLIQEMNGVYVEFHKAIAEEEPVIFSETPDEIPDAGYLDYTPNQLYAAAPVTGGVTWSKGVYVLWYMCSRLRTRQCWATSSDGINWEKHGVYLRRGFMDTVSTLMLVNGDEPRIWLDVCDGDVDVNIELRGFCAEHEHVYKTWKTEYGGPRSDCWGYRYHSNSPGTIEATEAFPNVNQSMCVVGDRTSHYYNPFRQVWSLTLRDWGLERKRAYMETRLWHTDFFDTFNVGTNGSALMRSMVPDPDNRLLQMMADDDDPKQLTMLDPRPQYEDTTRSPDLYGGCMVAYESIMVAGIDLWSGGHSFVGCDGYDIRMQWGFSRDGLSYDRPWRHAVIDMDRSSNSSWSFMEISSTTSLFLVTEEHLLVYVAGMRSRDDGICDEVTGLARLRRDGFASVNVGVPPESPHSVNRGVYASPRIVGTVITRALVFHGGYMYINVDMVDDGYVDVSFIDAGSDITLLKCERVHAGGTKILVACPYLFSIAARPVKASFVLCKARLYSFWVSVFPSGESGGYVGGGGPGFVTNRDL